MFRRSIQSVVCASLIVTPAYLFAQPPGRGGAPGGMQGGGGMRGGPPMEMILEIFEQADADKNGSVTKAELTAAMQNQSRGGRVQRGGPQQGMRGGPQQGMRGGQQQGMRGGERRGLGGPPNHEGGENGQQHGHHGPPQPGQVIPGEVAASLNLDERQQKKLAALQAEVDKRLAAILSDEQQEQLNQPRPPRGPEHGGGEHGARGGQRPGPGGPGERGERPK